MHEQPDSVPPQDNRQSNQTPDASIGSVSQTTGLAPNVAAGLTAVFPLVGSIIFLILEKKDEFVKFWALQSLYFGVAFLALNIILTVASLIPLLGCATFIVAILVSLAGLVLWVIGIIKAFQGERWLMPVIGSMVEKQLNASTSRQSI